MHTLEPDNLTSYQVYVMLVFSVVAMVFDHGAHALTSEKFHEDRMITMGTLNPIAKTKKHVTEGTTK